MIVRLILKIWLDQCIKQVKEAYKQNPRVKVKVRVEMINLR